MSEDIAVEYLYMSDTEVGREGTKCGEIFVSFSSFDCAFICTLCKNQIFKYLTLDEFINHIKGDHLFDDYNTEPVSPAGGFVAEILNEDTQIYEESDLNGSVEGDIQEENSVNLYEACDELESFEDETIDHEHNIEFMISDEDLTNTGGKHSIDQVEKTLASYRSCMTKVLDMYRKCIGLWHTNTSNITSNEVKAASFALLFEKYSTYYPERTLNDLQDHLNKLTKRFNAEYQSKNSVDQDEPWYFKHLQFLRFTNDVEISDEEFQDFNCPQCVDKDVGATCSIDLWSHITARHLMNQKKDPTMAEQTKLFTLQWPEENILQFIELYHEQECLWNVKSITYHNRLLKANAYKVIIEKYNEFNPNVLTDRDSVKSAIRHLRDYFGRVDKKYRTCNPLDLKASSFPLSRFKVYEKLLFLRKVYIPRRAPTVQIYTCELCGQSFNKKKDFNTHTKSDHANATYTCDKCSLVFRSQHNIELHRKEHMKTDGKTYACPICHENFRDSEGLATHLNEHLPKNLHKQICEICGAKFDDRSNLLIHIRRHNNTKNYICDVCNKGFVTSTELKSHVVVHSNEKPFVCETCGLRFKYSNRLSTHRLFHGEPKFKCMDCDMEFVTKRQLDYHRRMHAPADGTVEKVSCDICGSLFRNQESLQRHMRKIHKIKKRGQNCMVYIAK